MKITLLVLALLVAAAPAFAADVDGKWTGSFETPNGTIPIAFTFKADGAMLGGSMSGPDGGQIQIKNGKVDGANIAFAVDIDFGGMPLTLSYTGVVAAEQIKMTGDFMGMPFEFVVNKAKE